MSAICGMCGAESPTVTHRRPSPGRTVYIVTRTPPFEVQEMRERLDIGVASTFDPTKRVLASLPGEDWWTYTWGEDAFLSREEADARRLVLVRERVASASREVAQWRALEATLAGRT